MTPRRFSRADARTPKAFGPSAPPSSPAVEEGLEEDELTTAELLEEQAPLTVQYVHSVPPRFRLYAAILLCAYGIEEYILRSDLFDLPTASPLQRAVCRVINGYPLDGSINPLTEWPPALVRILDNTEDDRSGGRAEALDRLKAEYDERLAIVGEDLTQYQEVREAFDGKFPARAVKEILCIAAIRCAKTFIAAAALLHRSYVADLVPLRGGEVARAGIISWRTDLSATCFEFIGNAMDRSPLLRSMRVVPPPWRPGMPSHRYRVHNYVSDHFVDVLVITATRGGASALSKWYVAVVVDEAARMLSDFNEGVINYKDIRAAVFHRIRYDGFFMAISSPWLSTGEIYEASKCIGATGARCVVWAPGWAMNPVTWTPEACAAAKEADAASYRTDVEARFAWTDLLALPLDTVRAITTLPKVADDVLEHEPPEPADLAVCDASRQNVVSLAIAGFVDGKRAVVFYREWVGEPERPLVMKRVAVDVARWLKFYALDVLHADRLSSETLGELLEPLRIAVGGWEATKEDFAGWAARLEQLAQQGKVLLPDDERIRDDLAAVRRDTNAAGDVWVSFPTSNGPRQSASSRAILCAFGALYDELDEQRPEPETEVMRMHASMLRRHGFSGDALDARGEAVDELLERFDATGEFYG